MAEPKRRRGEDELEAYRSVVSTPTEFKSGFSGVAVAGAFFCGLIMMPGAIYLSLMTGGGVAAAWVTLIIFSEISRRAMRTLSQQELVILLVVAGAMAGGGPFAELVWRQYLVQSDAVRDVGLWGAFPSWYAFFTTITSHNSAESLGNRIFVPATPCGTRNVLQKL